MMTKKYLVKHIETTEYYVKAESMDEAYEIIHANELDDRVKMGKSGVQILASLAVTRGKRMATPLDRGVWTNE